MGNIMGKPDYRGVMIDGGPAQIKDKTKRTRIEFGQTPAINAQTLSRLRAESNEYDPVLVGKLIATKKLAPFYEGKFDEKGDGRSVGGTRSDRASVMTSESRRRAASQSRQVQQKKPSKKGKSPSVVDQSWLNTSLLECPICLLWYPKNINYCKCCKKPICTLCFVSMKRPNSPTKLISCPFCRHSNLTVVYRSPERILEDKKPKSSVVCENIRPTRIIIRPQPRPMYYRYNVAGGPPGQATFAQPRPTTGARQFTFYNPQNRPQAGGPAYPARQLYSPTRYPPATNAQPAPAAQQRVLTAQEVQAYEERALHRAIRLSMLDY